ncbi:hypothetical protein DFJ74DRAFT_700656 [Hyaloraphidium curvatum]|nr:hypothetical protein DFJ74DRAFT_700656 [Hyaloraphidium curvatum]
MTLLVVHEMDAVREREWRLLPFLWNIKDDELAFQTFTLLHVPLYLGIAYGLHRAPQTWCTGLSAFSIFHSGLHAFLPWVQDNFQSTFSKTIINGAALAGAADLVLRSRARTGMRLV